MKSLSMLIKPSSSSCNLRCNYCFYYDVCNHRETKSFGIMKLNLLETIVKKAFKEAKFNCTFAFQGGEPTLVGLDFFKSFIQFVNKYNVNNINVNYAIQTNGLLIEENWAKFLKENNFLVGISLDGPKNIHDKYRVDTNKNGSFNRVMKSINILKRYKVDFNILTVVTKYTARHISRIYNFFKKQDFRYLQFIPCLDPIDNKQGLYPHSLTQEDFGIFLNKLFDLWFEDFSKGRFVSIRYFEDLLYILLGYPPQSCCMNGFCSCQFVIESDGSVYPCDFYVFNKYKMGFIQENNFEELFNNENSKKFIKESHNYSNKCTNCKWFTLCRGGCRRNKEPNFPKESLDNFFCPSYKTFFETNINRLTYVTSVLHNRK